MVKKINIFIYVILIIGTVGWTTFDPPDQPAGGGRDEGGGVGGPHLQGAGCGLLHAAPVQGPGPPPAHPSVEA